LKLFLSSPHKKKQYLLLTVDAIIIFAVFVFAYAFRIVVFEGDSFDAIFGRFSWFIIIAVFIHLVMLYIFEQYNIELKRPMVNLLVWLTISVLLSVAFIAILFYIFPGAKLGRVIVFVHIPLAVFALFVWRIFFNKVLLEKSQKNKLVMIGDDCSERDIVHFIDAYTVINYQMLGVVSSYDEDQGIIRINGKEYGGGIAAYVKEFAVKTIVVGEKLKRSSSLKRELIGLKFAGIEIFDFPTFYQKLTARVPVHYVGEDWVLFSHQDRSFHPAIYLKLKRVFDITFSLTGLFLSAPILLAIAIIIKATSKGDLIFRQERLGLNEKPFTLMKFRTMIVDAERESGPVWTTTNDARVTRFGRFLRKSRLDELPQFVNILKGEMSFVGPRPIRRFFAEQLGEKIPYYRLRFTVKPGVTGWAQVRGDYAGSTEGQLKKMEYELFYIQHRSFFIDSFILLKTIQTMLFRRGQ